MTEYDYTELAYKNGFNAALETEPLRQSICKGLQHTTLACDKACKRMCNSTGECALCGTLAEAIRQEWGIK